MLAWPNDKSRGGRKLLVSARKYYEEALKLEPTGQYAKAAKEALGKLKKKQSDSIRMLASADIALTASLGSRATRNGK